MPTLSVCPPSLPKHIQSLHDMHGDWLVLEVYSRHEKRVATELAAMGVDYFLPIEKLVTRLGGKKRYIDRVVMPGYVFACTADAGQKYESLSLKSVYRHIDVKSPGRFVKQLEDVRLARDSGMHVEQFKELVVGCRVYVALGPFMGREGILISRDNHQYFMLQLDMLGQSLGVEMPPEYLEAA